MIICRTPFRVSLYGGGTDYPAYYEQHGGSVLGFTINKYCWISLRKLPPFFDYRHRVVYSKVELVKASREIEHPVVRTAFMQHAPYGLEMHHDGDLPSRSGLGSSSSFTVGLLNALHAFKGHMSTKSDLAMEAIHVERDLLKENVGSQDQVWAAYGGLNQIDFHRDGSFDVAPILVPALRRNELNDNLLLVFTGFARSASEIAGKQLANFAQRQGHLARMRQMVPEARAVIENPRASLEILGDMLNESWALKREMAAEVTTPEIDAIYDAARAAGATGGKLLGAGGGGFLLLYVPAKVRQAVRTTLHKLVEVPFRIGAEGSRIVLYEPEGL